jgi:Putative prokaryotic signal transducing protein
MKEKHFIDYELVLEIHNAGDQAYLKSILDAEGITYYIQGEHVAPFVFHSIPMRLMVKKDQAEKVRELLKDFEGSSAYGGLKKIKG